MYAGLLYSAWGLAAASGNPARLLLALALTLLLNKKVGTTCASFPILRFMSTFLIWRCLMAPSMSGDQDAECCADMMYMIVRPVGLTWHAA